MIEIKGSLLDSKTKYIAHQTNCTTMGEASGIAKAIFDRYKYSDIYKHRTEPSKPGSIVVCGDNENRYVINLNSQIYPGSNYIGIDSSENREIMFQKCLSKIAQINDLESIAFPKFIGCGLGGGNWDNYYNMINSFSKLIYDNQRAVVQIYDFNN